MSIVLYITLTNSKGKTLSFKKKKRLSNTQVEIYICWYIYERCTYTNSTKYTHTSSGSYHNLWDVLADNELKVNDRKILFCNKKKRTYYSGHRRKYMTA